MDMREATLKHPTNICRLGGSNNLKLTYAMTANAPKTASNNPDILICQQHSVMHFKYQMYHGPILKENIDMKILPFFLYLYI